MTCLMTPNVQSRPMVRAGSFMHASGARPGACCGGYKGRSGAVLPSMVSEPQIIF